MSTSSSPSVSRSSSTESLAAPKPPAPIIVKVALAALAIGICVALGEATIVMGYISCPPFILLGIGVAITLLAAGTMACYIPVPEKKKKKP